MHQKAARHGVRGHGLGWINGEDCPGQQQPPRGRVGLAWGRLVQKKILAGSILTSHNPSVYPFAHRPHDNHRIFPSYSRAPQSEARGEEQEDLGGRV